MFHKIVDDWNNMEVEALEDNGDTTEKNKWNLTAYAANFGLNYLTLYNYCWADVSKRMMTGNGVDGKPLMRKDQVIFVVFISAYANRSNEGIIPMDLTDKVQELCPNLDHKQAYR